MLSALRRHVPSVHGGKAFDAAFLLLLAGLAVIVLLTFDHYAISNDEEVQHRYGELILRYYQTGFADQAVFHFKNLYLYGGLFDVVAVGLSRVLPFDPFDIRHVLCAVIGIAGIGATWATARLIAGPRAALLAAIALASCGAWYGAMFNHTKDIPFAAAMMGATYFLLRIGRDLPRPRVRHLVGFALMLGAALGLRVGGLILIGYAGLMVLARTPYPAPGRIGEIARFWLRSACAIVPALVLAYVLMIAAWPWAALAPLNPLRGLNDFAQFHYEIRTLLFGHIYTMADVPRWYVPAYLLIRLTLAILIGAGLALAFAAWPKRGGAEGESGCRWETLFVAFTAAFPVLCHVIAHGPAFTGLRHFTFVIPPLAVLAGIGFDALLSALAVRRLAYAIAASLVLAANLAWDTDTLVRLHPYEYLYYNELVGGLAGAARQNETDYWVNIMPEAVEGLENFIDRQQAGHVAVPWRNYTVGVCGERFSFENEADTRLKWTPDWTKADFFVAPTHMACDGAANGKVIVTIERLGVPIGVVKDRRALLPRNVAHLH